MLLSQGPRHHPTIQENEPDHPPKETGGLLSRLEHRLFSTLEELKKDIESGGERGIIIKDAKMREDRLFSLMEGLSPEAGIVSFRLTKETKDRIRPLLEDTAYLFFYSNIGNEKRNALFNSVITSNTDEPYFLEITYGKNPKTGAYFIESIELILEIDGTYEEKVVG